MTIELSRGSWSERRKVAFEPPGPGVRKAHANLVDAVEAGAYAVSLAAVDEVMGLVAVSRAETFSGADWYLAPAAAPLDDLEDCVRLEVSGINLGARAEVRKRLRLKMDQVARGRSNLPAVAVVAGFQAREAAISEVVNDGFMD